MIAVTDRQADRRTAADLRRLATTARNHAAQIHAAIGHPELWPIPPPAEIDRHRSIALLALYARRSDLAEAAERRELDHAEALERIARQLLSSRRRPL